MAARGRNARPPSSRRPRPSRGAVTARADAPSGDRARREPGRAGSTRGDSTRGFTRREAGDRVERSAGKRGVGRGESIGGGVARRGAEDGVARGAGKDRGGRGDADRRSSDPRRAPKAAPFARAQKPVRSGAQMSRTSAHGERATGHGSSVGTSTEGERLQKVLSRLGVGSRREAEEWIRAGRITVNGEAVVLGKRVTRSDHLRLDGRLIHRHEIAAGQVYLCHRSPGENLRTPQEPSEHTALLERLPRRAGNRFITVSPMPRIDGGLEIVTSDGELAATLQRTIHSLPSEFSVRVLGELNAQQLNGVLDGVLDRGDKLRVEKCDPGGGEGANRWYTFVASGGSGKDVRQLFERQGALVSRVLRTRVGTLELDRRLSRGQFRPLSNEEIASLLPVETVPGDTAAGRP